MLNFENKTLKKFLAKISINTVVGFYVEYVPLIILSMRRYFLKKGRCQQFQRMTVSRKTIVTDL